MTSVMSQYERCSKCGHKAMITDFQTRTAEESHFCTACGYLAEWFIMRNEDGSPILNEHGEWQIDCNENEPRGAYVLEISSGVRRLGSIHPDEDIANLTGDDGFIYVSAWGPNGLEILKGDLSIVELQETEYEVPDDAA
jgi:hypothetical protein